MLKHFIANLAEFLSEYIIENKYLPKECELVTGGGFNNHKSLKLSLVRDIADLRNNREGGDECLILHALHAVLISQCNRINVVC